MTTLEAPHPGPLPGGEGAKGIWSGALIAGSADLTSTSLFHRSRRNFEMTVENTESDRQAEKLEGERRHAMVKRGDVQIAIASLDDYIEKSPHDSLHYRERAHLH